MPRGRATNGSGTIRQRKDGRWEAIYTIGRNPGTGKLVRKSVYGSTADEVARKLRAATAAIDENTYVEPEKMPLGKWLAIWEAEYLHSVKGSTARAYKTNNRLHIVPALGGGQAVGASPARLPDVHKSPLQGRKGQGGAVRKDGQECPRDAAQGPCNRREGRLPALEPRR